MWVVVISMRQWVWDGQRRVKTQISSVSQVMEDVCMTADRDGKGGRAWRVILYLQLVWLKDGGFGD